MAPNEDPGHITRQLIQEIKDAERVEPHQNVDGEQPAAPPYNQPPTPAPFDPDEGIRMMFSYHAPTPEQVDKLGIIRRQMWLLARDILQVVPASAERTLALRALHLANMHANSAIVFDGKRVL